MFTMFLTLPKSHIASVCNGLGCSLPFYSNVTTPEVLCVKKDVTSV